MPTNDKEYQKDYMKKYNKKYYKLYYEKNKDNINSTYYLPYRLELQRKYYKEKIGREPRKYIKEKDKKKFDINYGKYEIKFN
jgi:hypothetical protein